MQQIVSLFVAFVVFVVTKTQLQTLMLAPGSGSYLDMILLHLFIYCFYH